MKLVQILPPAAALFLVGIVWSSLHHSISTVEGQTVRLQGELAAGPRIPDERVDQSLAAMLRKSYKSANSTAVDWATLAEIFAHRGISGTQEFGLRRMIKNLSGPELKAAFEEIAALGLTDREREKLQAWLVEPLGLKEPQYLLEQCIGKINDPGNDIQWQLVETFKRWAAGDPATVASWLDRQIAAGKFERKGLEGESARLPLEAALLSSLLSTDLAAARNRIAGLQADQRGDIFRQSGAFTDLKPGSEKAFADLVRENVPEKQQMDALCSPTGLIVRRGGYEKVGKFLDDIQATPTERRMISIDSAKSQMKFLGDRNNITRQAVDEMRDWLAPEASGDVDRITGQTLAMRRNDTPAFDDCLKLIKEIHAENGSDELLIGFLSGNPDPKNRKASLTLAAGISDETKRAEIIAKLSR